MLVTLFVWMLATQCLRGSPNQRWGAVFAASLFAVHPIHTESVCWITGRSDAVGALFMVPSVVTALYYRDHRSPWSLILAPVLFLFALLSKEVTLSTLFVLPVLWLFIPKLQPHSEPARPTPTELEGKRHKKKKAPAPAMPGHTNQPVLQSDSRAAIGLGSLYFVATAIYFALRQHAHVAYGSMLNLTPSDMLSRALRATAYYLLKTIFPAPQLHFVPTENLPGIALSVVIILAVAAGIALIVVFFRSLRRLLFLSLAWFGCTVAPSLAVVVLKLSETPVAERYLYLPSIGFCFLLGALFCCAIEKKRLPWAPIGMAIIIIAGYGAGTLRRETVWQDNIRLWSDATRKAPDQGLPWTELGMAYTAKGKLDEALSCFRKAIQANYDNEGRSVAYNNIGMIHLRQHRVGEAESSFQAAIHQRPQYATPHYGLGLVSMEKASRIHTVQDAKKAVQDAVQEFQIAIRLHPNYVRALWGLTRAQMFLGDLAEKVGTPKTAIKEYRTALSTFERLVQIDPQFPTAHPSQTATIQKLRVRLDRLTRGS
jgi:Tfp pilus assembly protein PilF